jgi:hypothetical protein
MGLAGRVLGLGGFAAHAGAGHLQDGVMAHVLGPWIGTPVRDQDQPGIDELQVAEQGSYLV